MNNDIYAGFWIRTAAALIDSVLVMLIIAPLLAAIYDTSLLSALFIAGGTWGTLLNYVFPAVAIVTFWLYKSATPGKMLTHTAIVDATSGQKPTTGQFLIRYAGYYVSMLPLFAGIIWVGLDKRKQGWHDKLANTVVIRTATTQSQNKSD